MLQLLHYNTTVNKYSKCSYCSFIGQKSDMLRKKHVASAVSDKISTTDTVIQQPWLTASCHAPWITYELSWSVVSDDWLDTIRRHQVIMAPVGCEASVLVAELIMFSLQTICSEAQIEMGRNHQSNLCHLFSSASDWGSLITALNTSWIWSSLICWS